MFNRLAERALRAVGIGLVVEVGQIDEQRTALPRDIVRMGGKRKSEMNQRRRLGRIRSMQRETDIYMMDAGGKIAECRAERWDQALRDGSG